MKRALALLLSASLLATALPALGDAYDAAMARAAAAKEKALDANDAASWEEALARFREADALRATKESKYEVATAAAWLKQDDLAVEAYGEALGLGLSDPAKTKAEAFVAERQPKMAKLTVTGPAGARVLIDGRARAVLPRATPLVVFAGSLKVRVESAGEAREEVVTTTPGSEATFDGTPKPAPVVATPPAPIAPPPAPIAPPATPRDEGSRALGTTLLVSGGALAVLGLGTTILAVARVKTYEDKVDGFGCTKTDGNGYCTELPAGSEAKLTDAQDASNSVATWRGIRTAGIATAIGGGVIAVIGGVLLLRKDGPRASVAALPGGGFLTVSGAF